MTARRPVINAKEETVSSIKSPLRETVEWALYLGISILLALAIVQYLGRFTVVDGNSMQPTLQNRNVVIMENLSLRFHGVKDGDIVVLKIPELLGNRRTYAIKRIIATEGQKVRILDGIVSVDGLPIEEPYTGGIPTLADGSPYAEMVIPDHCVYILGDNRNPDKSQDSRVFGVVNTKRIIGKAFIRLFPFSRLGLVR